MKVVINARHGGFSLSYAACMRYAELCGFRLYAFVEDFTNGRKFIPYYGGRDEKETYYSKKPLTKKGKYHKKSYWSDRDIPRDDPILVQVVKELKKKANGNCATLKIVNVPDGTNWQIEEYAGLEWVAEAHQTWS